MLHTSVPTAVIATHDDDVVPHERQLALARAIPGATLRAIRCGHTRLHVGTGAFRPRPRRRLLWVAERTRIGGTPAPVRSAA